MRIKTIGESKTSSVLFTSKLISEIHALTLISKKPGESKGKKKLVFAPANTLIERYRVCQHGLKTSILPLPFEIYKLRDCMEPGYPKNR